MVEDYIKDYLERRIIITGNKDDFILSCNIHYDLNKELLPDHIISKTLINNTLINKKYMKSSQYYVGLKYK